MKYRIEPGFTHGKNLRTTPNEKFPRENIYSRIPPRATGGAGNFSNRSSSWPNVTEALSLFLSRCHRKTERFYAPFVLRRKKGWPASRHSRLTPLISRELLAQRLKNPSGIGKSQTETNSSSMITHAKMARSCSPIAAASKSFYIHCLLNYLSLLFLLRFISLMLQPATETVVNCATLAIANFQRFLSLLQTEVSKLSVQVMNFMRRSIKKLAISRS